MNAADTVAAFAKKALARERAIYHQVVFDTLASITKGSAVTGAAGQPVDTGRLRNSWHITRLSASASRIETNVVYARSIEDGVSYAHGGTPLTKRSQVGGFHSLADTVRNFDRIVADVTARVKRSPAFQEETAGDAP